jgi:hypothetical protein
VALGSVFVCFRIRWLAGFSRTAACRRAGGSARRTRGHSSDASNDNARAELPSARWLAPPRVDRDRRSAGVALKGERDCEGGALSNPHANEFRTLTHATLVHVRAESECLGQANCSHAIACGGSAGADDRAALAENRVYPSMSRKGVELRASLGNARPSRSRESLSVRAGRASAAGRVQALEGCSTADRVHQCCVAYGQD